MNTVALWIAGLGVLLWCLHRLALWLERRGWLFYVNRRPSSGVGNAFLDANSLFDYEARYRLEARRLEEAEEAERADDDLDKQKR